MDMHTNLKCPNCGESLVPPVRDEYSDGEIYEKPCSHCRTWIEFAVILRPVFVVSLVEKSTDGEYEDKTIG